MLSKFRNAKPIVSSLLSSKMELEACHGTNQTKYSFMLDDHKPTTLLPSESYLHIQLIPPHIHLYSLTPVRAPNPPPYFSSATVRPCPMSVPSYLKQLGYWMLTSVVIVPVCARSHVCALVVVCTTVCYNHNAINKY